MLAVISCEKPMLIPPTSTTYRPEGELLLDFAGGYDAYGQRRQSGKYNNTATLPEYYYGYNHKRERTVRSILNNGQTWAANAIQYVYDEDSHLIGEYKSDGTPIVEYVWKGDVPVVAIYGAPTATKTYQIITDALNTPRRLIDPATNAVVWSWDSTAFGVAPPSVETVKFNLRFPGQVYDDLTKQHYNLNRYYNPELGRYMEADPIGLEGGLNPYAYVGSNPVNAVDPMGLMDFNFDFSGMEHAFERQLENFQNWANSSPQWYTDTQATLNSGLWPPNIAANYSAADVANNKAAYGGNSFYNANLTNAQIGQYVVKNGLLPSLMVGVGGINLASPKYEYTTVTSWAAKGITPDLNPGRWVMKGEATNTNYLLTGLWGPKGSISPLGITKSNVPFNNSITMKLPTTQVVWPSGWEAWKGLFGQRRLRGD